MLSDHTPRCSLCGKHPGLDALSLEAGLKHEPHPYPLETVSEEVIESSIKCMEEIIVSFVSAGKEAEAEPFFKTLLILLEHRLGREDVKLLPILDALNSIYQRFGLYENCAYLLEWTLSIMDAHDGEHANRPKQLIRLARMYMRLESPAQAEAILNRISELFPSEVVFDSDEG